MAGRTPSCAIPPAADALGVRRVLFGGHRDGELEYSLARRGEICERIRRLRPDFVLGHDPWQRYRLHPDHRAAGLAAAEAFRRLSP
jgi:LmbE family N-acetylglucosaminyl deacetylase